MCREPCVCMQAAPIGPQGALTSHTGGGSEASIQLRGKEGGRGSINHLGPDGSPWCASMTRQHSTPVQHNRLSGSSPALLTCDRDRGSKVCQAGRTQAAWARIGTRPRLHAPGGSCMDGSTHNNPGSPGGHASRLARAHRHALQPGRPPSRPLSLSLVRQPSPGMPPQPVHLMSWPSQ